MRYVTLPLNHIHISSLLSLCGRERRQSLGASIHATVLKLCDLFNHELVVWNSLVSMYSKCGTLLSASKVFDEMTYRDSISWNSIISGCFINNKTEMGLNYFKRMRSCNAHIYDHATLTTLLSVCSDPKAVHSFAITNGLEAMVSMGNALITAYFKSKCPRLAQKVFNGMLERNLVTWTAMISGMAQSGMFDESLVLFRELLRDGEEANSLTYASSLLSCSGMRAISKGREIHGLVVKSGFQSYLCVESALMDLYSKCGMMGDACQLFRSCKEPDEIFLTVILVGFAQNEMEESAFNLFVEMVGEGIDIDANMISAVLGAFGASAPFAFGKQIHSLVIKKRLGANVFVSNGLINMYSKCGELEDSVKVFESMVQKNSVSWNSMIAAFARHGNGSAALRLYENMMAECIEPTDITFLSLLHACSHAGLIKKGMEFLASMSAAHGISPRMEHYSCVVDMLGRAGLLKEAKEFVKELGMKPKALLWQALLGACCIHGDLETGKYAAHCLLREEPDQPSGYVLLANIYSLEGKWIERARIVKKMKETGVKKATGVSSIEVEKEVHDFAVEDKGHPRTNIIYEVLGELAVLLKEEESTTQILSQFAPWKAREDGGSYAE